MDDPSAAYRKVDVKRARRFGLLEKKGLSGYLFILPFIIGFFAILLPTVATSFWYAFNNVRIGFGNVETEFIWFDNFREIIFNNTAMVLEMLGTLFSGVFIDVAIIVFFSFFISNVLNQKFLGRGAARMIFFLPVLLTTGIVAMMLEQTAAMAPEMAEEASLFDMLGWGSWFMLNDLMYTIGIPNIDIFGIEFLNPWSILRGAIGSINNIVNESGVQILIFLSALQSISPALFEAAKVEGATKWEEFWKITFPMLTPMILVAVVYSIITTFTNPRYGIMSTIQTFFDQGDHGFASALAWLYFAVIMLILGLVWLLIARRVNYLE